MLLAEEVVNVRKRASDGQRDAAIIASELFTVYSSWTFLDSNQIK